MLSFDEAVRRLDLALGLLEAATARRLETERSRADLETELQIMQDDRARLAVELDGALTRVSQLEAATVDVERRVDRAVGSVREVLERAEGPA